MKIVVTEFGNNTHDPCRLWSDLSKEFNDYRRGLWKRTFHHFGWGMLSGSLKTVNWVATGTGSVLTIMFNSNSDSDRITSINSFNGVIRLADCMHKKFLYDLWRVFADWNNLLEWEYLNHFVWVFDDGVLMAEHMICHRLRILMYGTRWAMKGGHRDL